MPQPVEVTSQGPILIGTIINTFLFGIMIVQGYVYYTSFNRRDNISLKLFVVAIFLLNAVNTVFDVVYVYEHLVLHYGDIKYLEVPNWQDAMNPALTGIIGLMVQLFFIWRIYKFTRNWLLVVISTIPTLVGGGCAMFTARDAGLFISQISEFEKFEIVIIVWLSCAAAADITITMVLVWHLWGWKTNTMDKASKMLIDRIIIMTVQTGLITSIVATINLATFLADCSTDLHMLFNFTLCKLYSNSLMSNLNSRSHSEDDDVNPTVEIAFRGESLGQSDGHNNSISSC